MNVLTIKLNKLEFTNIKNTNRGEINFPKSENIFDKSQIIGIYGQNGSGKTAVIQVLSILKKIMSGNKLDREVFNFITNDQEEATFSFDFSITNEKEEETTLTYEFGLKKIELDFVIDFEKVSYKTPSQSRTSTLMKTERDNIDSFGTKTKYDLFKSSNNKETLFNLEVIRRLSSNEKRSFIFNDQTLKIIKKSYDPYEVLLLNILKKYAQVYMMIILNEDHSMGTSDIAIPFFFRIDSKYLVDYGKIVAAYDDLKLEIKSFEMLNKIIKQLNIILCEIIPGLKLKLNNLGPLTMKDGKEGVRAELLSIPKEGALPIPLKYESDGIKKIISILSSLVAMYNKPNVLVAIDELDSTIFEYLLGELLEIFSESAKGQLIFTSHNLRPLEVLSSKNIYFTTTNSYNRYVQFTNVKETNNLRGMYYREVILGSPTQKEKLSNEIKIAKVRHAFRRAGKEIDEGKDDE